MKKNGKHETSPAGLRAAKRDNIAAALLAGVPVAKTAAERQADRKARQLAAGLVQWKRWVHPDDVPALAEYAEKLARKRQRTARAG